MNKHNREQLDRILDEVQNQNWRDAERYRWLRERFIDGMTTSKAFDATIDRAMAAAQEGRRTQNGAES